MDCQHVQQLLPFVLRKSEELDAIERAAVQQHLATCPACAAFAQAESRADAAFGSVMRDVPVPADLQQKVMNRLSAGRSRLPWKTAAAAAVVLMAIGGGLFWHYYTHPKLTFADAESVVVDGSMSEAQINGYLAERGLPVSVPDYMDYEYLQHVDIVEFKGQRVAKLTFSRTDHRPAIATLLILPTKQFRIDDDRLRKDKLFPNTTSIWVHPRGEQYVDLIYYRPALEPLKRELQ